MVGHLIVELVVENFLVLFLGLLRVGSSSGNHNLETFVPWNTATIVRLHFTERKSSFSQIAIEILRLFEDRSVFLIDGCSAESVVSFSEGMSR